MTTKLTGKIVLTKSFNNNIVLVRADGKEKILFAKGIGFGKKFGDIIPDGIVVDRIFTIENEDNIRNFNRIVSKIDNGFIAACEEAICEVATKTNQKLNENIHIGLIDHLSFAISRLKNNEEIQNPFIVEVQTLYPIEYSLAEMVAERVGTYSDIKIPEGEIGFIALHVHSAINNGKLSNTIKYSYLSSKIIPHIEKRLNVKINKKSLDYARFLTHIRFAIERIITNCPINSELIDVVKKRYKKAYKIAEEVAEIMKAELFVDICEAEISYLAIHIERFRVSLDVKS